MSLSLGFFVSAFGGVVALLALASDIAGRFGTAGMSSFVDTLGVYVQFRNSESPRDSLRQFFALAGTIFLLLGAALREGWIYVFLEALLFFSTLVWYIDVSSNPKTSETVKGYVRFVVAVGVGIWMWALGYCQGLSLVCVIGLELLGCSFVLREPVRRDAFVFAGGAVLSIYAILGLIYEPELRDLHSVWTTLNVPYGLFGGILLWDSISQAKSPAATA